MSNAVKDPDDWTTGEEPMTGAQASYLKTLSGEAVDPGAYDPELMKAEASKRIDTLQEQTGRPAPAGKRPRRVIADQSWLELLRTPDRALQLPGRVALRRPSPTLGQAS